MPRGDVSNYFFKGNKDLLFDNVSDVWVNQNPRILMVFGKIEFLKKYCLKKVKQN